MIETLCTFVSLISLECRTQTPSVALPRSSTVESSWRPLALKSFLGVKEAFKDSGAVAAVVADVDVDVMVADKVVVDIIGVKVDAVVVDDDLH